MKSINKLQKSYLAIWAVLFASFQVIAFITPGWAAYNKYTPSFWIGYGLITLSFIGQLLCALTALKEEDSTKLFYKLSLIRISYTGLIVSFVAGGACMLLSPLPYWVGAIVAVAVLGICAICVIKAGAAVTAVAEIDEKVSKQTFFIRNLTAEAEGLAAGAKTAEEKALCKKVYEALRYSDPMSSPMLSKVEEEIEAQFAAFSHALSQDAAQELLALIAERNRKCKLLK